MQTAYACLSDERQAGPSRFPALLFAVLLLAVQGCATQEKAAPPAKPAATAPEKPAAPSPETPSARVFDAYGRLVVEAMEYPWSALGRVNMGGRNFCTGALIGPSLVLTPARCLYNAVEGRWWAAGEVHFVAGYQRDAAIIHAAVRSYEVPPAFRGANPTSLANAGNDWALLSLAKPIGRLAGWFGLRRLDSATRARLRNGAALALQAGYRRGWAHSQTLRLTCLDDPSLRSRREGAVTCAGAPGHPELPALLFLDGEFRAAAAASLLTRLETRRIKAGASHPPRNGGPAAAAPRDTAAKLLHHLGYLKESGQAGALTRAALTRAIEKFERIEGLPANGKPTAALLGRLMTAARDTLLPPPKVSMAGESQRY